MRVGMITVSDRAYNGIYADKSGPAILEWFRTHAPLFEIIEQRVVPDRPSSILETTLREWTTGFKVDLILTTGGTGIGPYDKTPETIRSLMEKEATGIEALLLTQSLAITPFAALSRPVAGIICQSLVITLPGSPKACTENLTILGPKLLQHAIETLQDRPASQQHPPAAHTATSAARTQSLNESDHRTSGCACSSSISLRPRHSPWPLVPVEEAWDILRKRSLQMEPIEVTVNSNLLNARLARPVIAKAAVPAVRTSIVDGYALSLADHFLKGELYFQVVEKASVAGTSADSLADLEFNSTQALRVNTGAPLPSCVTRVIMVEQTEVIKSEGEVEKLIRVESAFGGPKWIREVGSDVQPGEVLATEGTVVDAMSGLVGLFHSAGVRKVWIHPRPRVAILSTGNELRSDVTSDVPKGFICDTNGPTLAALLHERGFPTTFFGVVSDEVNELERSMKEALKDHQVLITTGGVSMGEKDYVKPVLQHKLNATIHFGRVNMKPGKPTTFATLPGGQMVFGLPGNPVSAMVTFHLFVWPALQWMSASPDKDILRRIPVHLTEQVRLDLERPEYQRARLHIEVDGKDGNVMIHAKTTGDQQSSRLLSMSGANGLLELPTARVAGKPSLKAGETVQAIIIGSL